RASMGVAGRSTVLAPPPAPGAMRPTVVLRAGPPPKKGLLDGVIGAIGVLLLLATVGLAVALPHKDVLPQQFKVAYLDEAHDLTQQSFDFRAASGQTHDFLYEVPDDDVYLLTVKYEFVDDVPASLPDQFSLRLYDPQGNQVGPEVVSTNLPAQASETVGSGPAQAATGYQAVRLDAQFSVALPKPADDILEVADQGLDAAALAKQLEATAHLDTHGTWKLRVSLLGAGGCPKASDSPEAANRFAICQQELQAANAPPADAAAGKDGGNPFTVGVFSYSRFAPDIQKIG
ncbi:MAG: hypothetical protein QOI63_1642, partial [Thermoplasmata archaeon]|nr:hypothetical protein [Thermoplasmata archaeon]